MSQIYRKKNYSIKKDMWFLDFFCKVYHFIALEKIVYNNEIASLLIWLQKLLFSIESRSVACSIKLNSINQYHILVALSPLITSALVKCQQVLFTNVKLGRKWLTLINCGTALLITAVKSFKVPAPSSHILMMKISNENECQPIVSIEKVKQDPIL